MKKTLSCILSLIIILMTLFCVPFNAQAAIYEPDRKIYAQAYMLINLDDDSYPVVAEKNADERLYPASLTKIVTAMVVLNNVKDLNATTKMSQSAFDATLGTGAQVAGIKVGGGTGGSFRFYNDSYYKQRYGSKAISIWQYIDLLKANGCKLVMFWGVSGKKGWW